MWTARRQSAAEERAAASAALSSSGRAAQDGKRPMAAGLPEDVSLCPQTPA